MAERLISFADQTLRISYPQQAAAIIDFTFRDYSKESRKNSAGSQLEVFYSPRTHLFSLENAGQQIGADLSPADLSLLLLYRSTYSLIRDINGGITIHGAAVQRNNRAVLMPGKSSSGKSILTSWLLSKGYGYLTDELVYFPKGDDYFLTSLCRPLHIREKGRYVIEELSDLHGQENHYLLQSDQTTIFSHRIFDNKPVCLHPKLSLLLFIEHHDQAELTISSISPARAAGRLMESLSNARNLKLHGFDQIASLTRETPAIVLQYGELSTLENILEPIIDFSLETHCTPLSLQKFIGAFQRLSIKQASPFKQPKAKTVNYPIPEATKRGKKRKLTIGMATYDDFDGVYFSVQALRMYHPEIVEECEILVIDNHPDGPCAENLKKLDQYIDGYRYVPLADYHGTSVRDHIFIHASSDNVLCIDCHVFIVPGAIKELIRFFDKNPDCQDFLQGPVLSDDLKGLSTHFKPLWRNGMYGTWATDPRAEDSKGNIFEISMQGLGLFACRKESWPGFNPQFRGFGGEEGYIHEKFRQAGRKTLCLPFLRWLHRFFRPMGVPYVLQWEDRIRNYWVGHKELNLDIEPIKKHFRDFLGSEAAERIYQTIETELASPFSFFDAIYCITLSSDSVRWHEMEKRFRALGIAKRVRIFHAVHTPENHHIGCALSHRAVILSAKQQNLKNVLIFEDDALFLDKTLVHISKSIEELKIQAWNLFYLGGHSWGGTFEYAPGCSFLQQPHGLTCTHALAYNRTIYDKILHDLPDSVDKMELWLQTHHAIDQYLRGTKGVLIAAPVVSSQIELLPREQKRYRDRFTLTSSSQ